MSDCNFNIVSLIKREGSKLVVALFWPVGPDLLTKMPFFSSSLKSLN